MCSVYEQQRIAIWSFSFGNNGPFMSTTNRNLTSQLNKTICPVIQGPTALKTPTAQRQQYHKVDCRLHQLLHSSKAPIPRLPTKTSKRRVGVTIGFTPATASDLYVPALPCLHVPLPCSWICTFLRSSSTWATKQKPKTHSYLRHNEATMSPPIHTERATNLSARA